jgi:Rod binding domain-containing protein
MSGILPAAAAPAESPRPLSRAAGERRAALRDRAEAFESVFLAAMLREAGYGAPRAAFGGGAGEDAFAGLLADAQAERIVAGGGLGLAGHIFRALLARDEAAHAAAPTESGDA